MLTDQALENMAQAYPLNDTFCTFGIAKWFWNKYNGPYREFFCDQFVARVISRATPLGFQPVGQGSYRRPRVLLDETQIDKRVHELGHEIGRDYKDKSLTFVGILNACAPFMMRLVDVLPASVRQFVELDFLQAASRDGTESTGNVKIVKDTSTNLQGRDVIIVEGIVGTGLTLNNVIPLIEEKEPRSVHVCTLLNKRSCREYNVPIRYCGFEVPDQFVIGFGLDHNQRFRALPHIAVLPQ